MFFDSFFNKMPAPVQLSLLQFNKKEKKDTPSHATQKCAHREPYKEMGGETVQAHGTQAHSNILH